MAWYGKNSAHELHIGDGRAFHCIVFYKINFSRKHVEQSFPNHFGISPLQERGSQSGHYSKGVALDDVVWSSHVGSFVDFRGA